MEPINNRIAISGLLLVASVVPITLNIITGPAHQIVQVVRWTVCASIFTAVFALLERTGTAALTIATMLLLLVIFAVLTLQRIETAYGFLGGTLVAFGYCLPTLLIGIILIAWGLFRGSSEVPQ